MGRQEQKDVFIKACRKRVADSDRFAGGRRIGHAVATGNNAAWLCRCGYARPLLGTTFNKNNSVYCPACSREYQVQKAQSGDKSLYVATEANKDDAKLDKIIVANIGLFYVCHELSRRGFNVVPTSRNTRAVDVIVGSADFSKKVTVQVKASTTTIGCAVASYPKTVSVEDAKMWFNDSSSVSPKVKKVMEESQKVAVEKSKLADFWVFPCFNSENGYTLETVFVCKGGDTDVMTPGNRQEWWYSPLYKGEPKEWEKLQDARGWSLIESALK